MRQFPKVFLLLTLFLPVSSKAAPVYLNPSNGYPSGEHTSDWLEKRTTEIKVQKWYRLKLNANKFAWTSEEGLLTRSNLIGRAFIVSPSPVYSQPRKKNEDVKFLEAGDFATVLGESGEFLKIRNSDGVNGYTPKANCITSRSLGPHEAIVGQPEIVLRTAAAPDAKEVRVAKKLSRYTVVDTKTIKWGRVELDDNATAWWKLDDVADDNQSSNETPKYSSSEIFLKRKIFDIASSPVIPNLRFASANGIFRTIDDKHWEKLSRFGDQNYPIAIAKSGRLFIGFWYSDDHGQSFHSFVRFDQLISSLKNRWRISPHRFKFIGVRPVNDTGSHLVVRVDIGLKKPVEALTRDQGITWKAL